MFARPAAEFLPHNSPLLNWTLDAPDAWLRHHMMFGRPDSALSLLGGKTSAAPDALLRSLQRAIVLRDAGDYAGSNALLEWAEAEADRRSVRSVSQTVGSFLVNDRVLSYVPSLGESGMIPFYRMLNYASLNDFAGAAVEARRVSSLLAREDRGTVRRCAEDGMLRYIAGLVFEAAGELNDALVSLRLAEADFTACPSDVAVDLPPALGNDLYRLASKVGVDEVADSARSRYPSGLRQLMPGRGEVLVIIERGFISHLTEEAVDVPILLEELDSLEADDSEAIAAAGAAIAARLTLGYGKETVWGRGPWEDRYWGRRDIDLDDIYILRLAWPGIRNEGSPSSDVRLLVGTEAIPIAAAADLSIVAEQDLQARRVGMLGRLITRGLLKYLIAREAEEKAEEEGGKILGTVTGLLANAAANHLERADTRSWTLLPNQLAVARATVPAGSHQLRLQVLDPVGGVLGTIELESVEVRPGRLTVLQYRMWSDDPAPRAEIIQRSTN